MRCVGRQGFASTSMADIIAESGLSAGSIYSHFDGKADLVRYAARTVFDERQERFTSELATRGTSPTPIEAMLGLLASAPAAPTFEVVLQLWAETPTDPELAAIARSNLQRIRDILAGAILGWARDRTDGEEAARVLADETAGALQAIMQGFVVQSAIGSRPDPARMLDVIRVAFRD